MLNVDKISVYGRIEGNEQACLESLLGNNGVRSDFARNKQVHMYTIFIAYFFIYRFGRNYDLYHFLNKQNNIINNVCNDVHF